MKIVLVCGAGMSTSILVQKMVKEAANREGDFNIYAVSLSGTKGELEDADIVLLGPQVSFKKNELATKFAPVPVEVINSIDYGMMDGKKVLDFAIEKSKK